MSLNKKEIIKDAKVIILPDIQIGNKDVKHNTFSNFIKKHQSIKLPSPTMDSLYTDTEYTRNQFTTEWHYRNTIPAMEILLNLPYKSEDFTLITNKLKDGDFSSLVSKDLQNYSVLTYKKSYSMNENGEPSLTVTPTIHNCNSNEITNCTDTFDDDCIEGYYVNNTNYHKLFKYSGISCIIYNTGDNYVLDRTLLVSCDTNSSPIIPILARYYRKVIYLDNTISEYGIELSSILSLENEKPDDVIIIVSPNEDIEKYTDVNLM